MPSIKSRRAPRSSTSRGRPLFNTRIDITLNGLVELGGELRVQLDPAYNPPADTAFTVMTWPGAMTGHFAVAHFPGFPDERFMRAIYSFTAGGGKDDGGKDDGGIAGGGSVSVYVDQLENLGGFEDGGDFPLPGSATDGVLGDFDLDGNIDLAITIPDANQSVNPGSAHVLFNAGTDIDGNWLGFTGSDQYTVGVHPSAITTAQLDGDGANSLDLAVTNMGDSVSNGTVSLLFNDGAGNFSLSALAGGPITVGVKPLDIAAGEFDNAATSAKDLIVANNGSDTLTLLLNNGSGQLAAATVPGGVDPVHVDPADLDNDRDTDVAVLGGGGAGLQGGSGTDALSVHFNNNDGSFFPPVFYDVGDQPSDLAVGLLNGDEFIDIAVTTQADDALWVLINKASSPGTFDEALDIPAPDQPRSLVLADLHTDAFNDLDVGILGQEAGQQIVQVLRNDTEGGASLQLAPEEPEAVDDGAIILLAGDVDNQNGEDLVIINESGGAFDEGGDGGDGGVAGGGAEDGVSVLLNSSSSFCLGDIPPGEGDGAVNIDDLFMVIAAWGPCAPSCGEACPEDFDDDCNVDIDDLFTVIAAWGPCM